MLKGVCQRREHMRNNHYFSMFARFESTIVAIILGLLKVLIFWYIWLLPC